MITDTFCFVNTFFEKFLGGSLLRQIHRRLGRYALLCSLCEQPIMTGQEYWYCNGTSVCHWCLNEFARAELAPYHQIRGKEVLL